MIIDYQTRDNGAQRHSFSPRRYVAICLCLLLLCSGLVLLLRAGQSAAVTRGLTARDVFGEHFSSPSSSDKNLAVASTKNQAEKVGPNGKVLGIQNGENGFLSINVPTNLKSLLTATSIVIQGDAALNGQTTVNGPATFLDQVILQGAVTLRNNITGDNVNIDVGGGTVTASNLVYSVTAGSGISISGTQDLVISSTVSVPDVKTFKKIVVGGNTVEAGSIDDTLTLSAGNNINLSSSGKTITIAAVSASAGWQIIGNDVSLENNAYNVGMGTNSPAAKLHVLGDSGTGTALIVDQAGSGDLLDVRSSGSTLFLINNAGQLTASALGTFTNGLTVTGPLTLTGFSTPNGILYTNGSGVVAQTGQGASGTVLHGNGAGAPTFGQVDLTTDVTGTLPIVRGGTNGTATPTAGAIAYGTGTAYAFSTAGSAGQCLVSGGAGAPSWTTCGTGGGGSDWIVANGSIYPVNSTLDLLVGGQSTASAKFAVNNINTGVPELFLSDGNGNLYLTADGEVYTTNTQNLTLGNATTGNIVLNPTGGSGTVSSTGTLNLSSGKTYQIGGVTVLSSTTLGSGVTLSSLTQVGALNSGSIVSGFGTITTANPITGTVINGTTGINTGAGAGTQRIDLSGNLSSIGNINAAGTITFSTFSTNKGVLYTDGSGVLGQTAQGAAGTVLHGNGTSAPSWSAIDLTTDVTGVLPIARGGTNSTATPTAGTLAYGTGTGYAFTAQGLSGQCIVSNGSGAPVWAECSAIAGINWRIQNGTISPINDTLDFLVGGAATSSAKFAVLNVNSGTPTASVSAGATGGTYFTADGNLSTTANQTLTLGGSTSGNIVLNPIGGSGTVTSTGTLNLASGKTYQINGTDVLSSTTLGSGVTISSLTQVGALTVGSIANGFGTIDSGNTITGTVVNATTSINTGAGPGTARIDSSGNLGNIGSIGASGTIQFTSLSTNKGVLYADGSGFLAQTGQGATGTVLHGNGSSAPSFSAVDLTADVSGVLPIARGGTNGSATPTAGGIAYGTGTAYAFTSAGSGGECLVSGGAGTPVWSSCSASSGLNWTIGSGAIYPINSTLDMLVGGTSTASAKFAVLNVNSGTPTASISASSGNIATYLTGDGTLATTNRQTLTIGNSSTYNTTGNVLINSNGTGSVGIGTTTPAGLFDVWAGGSTKLKVASNGNLNIGGDVSIANGSTGFISLSGGGFWFGNSSNTNIGSTTSIPLIFTTNNTEKARIDTNGNLGIGTTTPVAPLHISKGYGSNASLIVNNPNSGDLFTASASGTTKFTIANNGDITATGTITGLTGISSSGTVTFSAFTTNGGLIYTNGSGVLAQTGAGNTGECLISSGGGTPTWASCSAASGINWRFAAGALSPINDTVDVLIGGSATSSAKFAFLNVNSGTPTASVSAGAAGATYLTADGTLATTANQTLTLGSATTGGINLFNFSVNGGLLYTNGSGTLTQTLAGNNGECLISSGGGTPTWQSCSASSGLNWRIASGAISPINDTLDLLIGSNASASAKFAVLNVNSGTPTASISGSTAGNALSLTGDGTISTSKNRTLLINPNGGRVGIGTSTPAVTLEVSSVIADGPTYNGIRITNSAGTGTGRPMLDFYNSAGNAPPFSHARIYSQVGSGFVNSSLGIQVADAGQVLRDRLVIDVNGNVGIGTTTPVAPLHISRGYANNAALIVNNPNSGDLITASASGVTKFTIANDGTASISGTSTNALSLTGDGTIATTLNRSLLLNPNGGNVGIGVANAVSKLQVGGNLTLGDGTNASSKITFMNSGDSTNASILVSGGVTTISGAAQGSLSSVTLQTLGGQLYLKAKSGGSNDGIIVMYTGSTPSERLRIDEAGNVGIGTTTPVAPLHISKGYGSNAALIVNNTNSGDLITASASGTTRFTIANNGNITAGGTITGLTGITSSGTIQFSNLNTAGGVVYTDNSGILATSAQGSSGQCLVSNGSGAPSWASCAASSGSVFTSGNGLIYPINSTMDFAIGGQSTASAKFAVLNVNTGTPVASISANSGNIATYLTGDGTLATTNRQTLTIGNSSTYNTTGNILLNPNGTGTVAIGTTTPVGQLHVGLNPTATAAYGLLSLGNGTWTGAGNNFIGSSGGTYLAINDNGGTFAGDFLDFQVNNNKKFVVSKDGYVGIGGNFTSGYALETNGGTIRSPQLLGTNGLTFDTNSAKAISFIINSGTASMKINPDGKTGIGTTAAAAQLHIAGGGTTYPTLMINNTSTSDILTASVSGTTKFTIANNGNITASGTLTGLTGITSSGTIQFSALNTAGGIVYTDASGVLATSAQGSSGNCLQSNGASAPSWGSCGVAGNNWTIANGSIYPINTTLDMLVGGTSTSSAKFAVLNINSGTPTASVSAGAAGATYLTADGSLGTTAQQTLVLGTSTTGNITLAPNSGSGTVTSTGTLTLASGKTYQINGTDVLSSSTLGSGITVSSLTTVGALTSGSIASGFGTIATGNSITGTTLNGTVGINTGASAGTQRIDSSGNLVNIGTINASGAITFSTFSTNKGVLFTDGSGLVAQTSQGATGTVLHGNGTSAPTFSAVVLTADVSGVLPIANGGTNTNTTPTAGAIAYGTGTAYAFSAAGSSGQCLTSGGTGAPGWSSCAGAAGALFTSSNGLIYPLNSTMDFAIGGTSTASAKFAVLNVNSGTPTASVSAGATGAAFLTADGTLSTTARQPLTIGNSSTYNTTGNVLINPNGTGNVGIGTTTPAIKLEIAGSAASGATIPAIRLTDTSGDTNSRNWQIANGSGAYGTLEFKRSVSSGIGPTSVAFAIDGSGNVGVGDATPASLFTVGSGDLFQVNSSGNIVNIGGAAHSISNSSGALNIDSASTGAINLGTSANAKTITIGNGTGATALAFTSGTGSQTFTSSATTNNAFAMVANSLTTGTGLSLTSTSTALSTGGLASFDWSPGSATTTTGDLLSLNVGANGTLANIFNVKNGGSSVFSVSQSQITAALPTQFTAAGDVGIAYDLNFTNPTSSFIRSNAPLYLQSGETFNSSDLTLRTFNSGNLVFDTAGGVTLANGNNWTLPSASTSAWAIGGSLMNFDTTNSRIGIGTNTPNATLDVTGTASVSGNLTLGANSVIQPAYGPLTLNYKSGANTWAAGLILQDTTGNVGVGTSAPHGAFMISKGYSNNASFIVNNPNSGDLITASASGVTKFTVSNGGAASASGTLTLGGTSGIIQSADGPLTLNYKSAANTWAAGLTLQQTTGNVGIGTTNPATLLAVNGAAVVGGNTQAANSTELTVIGNLSVSGYIRNSSGSNVLQIGSGSFPTFNFGLTTPQINGYSNQDLIFNTGAAAYSHVFKINSVEKVRIDSTGNVGIGTASPVAPLHISTGYANNAALIVNNTNSGNLIAASASGVTKFTLDGSGNASASGTLTLGGTSGIIQPADGPLTLNYKSGANTWAAGLTLQQTSGNVGIGTTNPTEARLHVRGTAGSAPALKVQSGDTESVAIELADGNASPFRWWLLSGLGSGTDGTFSIYDKDSSASRLNIDQTGNVGIGDGSPNVRLTVTDSQTTSYVANIYNQGNNDDASNSILDLRTQTGSTGTSARFMRFYASASTNANGTGVGRIRLNNGNVAYETGGADFAEWFNINGGAEPGDLIAVSSNGNVKASNGASILGVVSDTAAFIGNAKTENPGPNDKTVGLVGQIKTKVSTMNGVIRAGDPIMSSSIPGVGQKTVQAAHIVGKAMEDFDPANGKGEVISCPAGTAGGVTCGKIMVSVQATYYNPNVVNPEQLNFVANQQAAQQASIDDLQASFEIATTGELKIKKSVIFTQAIVAQAKATFNNVVDFLGDVNFKGNVTFSNPIVFESKDVAGFAKIKAGDNEVHVQFSKQYMSLPVTNVTPDNPDVRAGIKDRSTNGFTIYLKQPATQDENFSWSAVIVKDVETVVSTGSASLAPSPSGVPSSSPSSAPTAQPSSSPAASPTPSASPVSSPAVTPSPSASPVSSPTP